MATSGYMKGKGDAKKSVSAGQVSAGKINTSGAGKKSMMAPPGKKPNMVGSKSVGKVNTSSAGKKSMMGTPVKPDSSGGISKRFGGSK